MVSSTDDLTEGLKILFTGLNNAGKTSIVLTLLRDFNKIAIIKPTTGVERRTFSFLGLEISEWDLGGQIYYRQKYLNNPEKYFGDTEILIYVIDIQDKDHAEEAITYLEEIIQRLRLIGIEPSIYIFFHKFDPDMGQALKADANNLSLSLRNRIRESIVYPKFEFYRTSVFDLHSIYHAMSKILLNKIPKSELIEKAIAELGKKLDFDGLELIDDNSLIISSYYKNKNIKQLLNSISPFFLEVNDTFEQAEVIQPQWHDEPDDEMMIKRFGKFFVFRKFKLHKVKANFYLLSCKNDADFDAEAFDTFVNLISEILQME